MTSLLKRYSGKVKEYLAKPNPLRQPTLNAFDKTIGKKGSAFVDKWVGGNGGTKVKPLIERMTRRKIIQ